MFNSLIARYATFQFARYITCRVPLCNPSSLRFYSKKSGSSNRWIERQINDSYTREAKHFDYKSRAAFKLLQIDDKFKIFSKDRNINVLDLGAAPGAWSQVALERAKSGSNVLGVDLLVYRPPPGSSSMQANILSKKTHEAIREHFKIAEIEKLRRKLASTEVIINQTALEIQETSIIESENKLSDAEEREREKREKNLESVFEDQLYRPVDVVLSDMYVPLPQIGGFASQTTNMPFLRMANTSGLSFKDHSMSMDLCDAALVASIDVLKKNGHFITKFFTGKEDKHYEMRLRKVFRRVYRYKPKACRPESKECYFVCMDKLDDFIDKKSVFQVA
ncbi:hypothetical protein OGAPHI_002861 [Ogataea philodendri]|uniref:rRNA methyltransferase 2, mitochondrial n=1 Tax=Ogataea philodendri TaxID=1378263 RepID=A0A9P8P9E9_9ASCO|nr:uncharacterized protein OGAPHI_002861 [Ogataea philodendri]KAH3667212.1 hypothetical protein OGAPHI_002861 [Ogataea philodendri]